MVEETAKEYVLDEDEFVRSRYNLDTFIYCCFDASYTMASTWIGAVLIYNN